MAKMYPSRLPDRILNNPIYKGEVDTFNALSKLPDDFEIFYNRCANSGASSRAYERKIDFTIIHEQLGLLAMEVKGGRISIGSDGGFEQYHPKKGKSVSIEPFEQVKIALREMIITIKRDGANYWIPDNVCVLFPGTPRLQLTASPQSLPAGTLCADDMALLSTIIPTLFGNGRKGAAWKRDAFIDIRRRLQNMPEAKGKTTRKNKQDDKPKFLKPNSWAKKSIKKVERIIYSAPAIAAPEEPDFEEAEDDYAETFQPIGEIRTNPQRHKLNYDPSINYVPSPPEILEKPKLKKWEIVAVIAAFTVTFLLISWLFPNSFIHYLL